MRTDDPPPPHLPPLPPPETRKLANIYFLFQVGSLFALGTVLFSGSCYVHALTGNTAVRRVTPYGGMLLIAGWLAVIF